MQGGRLLLHEDRPAVRAMYGAHVQNTTCDTGDARSSEECGVCEELLLDEGADVRDHKRSAKRPAVCLGEEIREKDSALRAEVCECC